MTKSTLLIKFHIPIRFFLALTLLLLGFNTISWGQTTLAAWNFPTASADAICDGGITANLAKTITLVNTNTTPENTIDFTRGGNTTNCASSLYWQEGSGTKCFVFNDLVTTGYSSINFSAVMKGNNKNSPRDFKIQYNCNNGTWIDVGSTITLNYTGYLTVASNLSLPSADNQADIDIRIIQTSDFSINNGAIGTGTSAWVEIDDIEIKGTAMFPNITVSPATLTGFTYVAGSGPSSEKSFTVDGINLTANITVTPPANFEISTGTGGSFVPTNPITLPVIGGTVSTTTIYVRLKAGLAFGVVASEVIASSSAGATTIDISCSGTVKETPIVTVTPDSFTGFTYELGNGPSTIVPSFNVTGSNLVGNILVTPPTDYQISLSATNGFTLTPIMLNADAGGNVNSPPIYVRLKSGLAVGIYNEQISVTSTSAITQTTGLSGNVINVPAIKTSTTSLGGFIYTSGAATLPEQSFTLSGTFLKGDILVTAPLNYEIRTAAGSFGSSITLAQTDGIANEVTLFVRLKGGLGVGVYNLQDIVCTSTDAINKNITCGGAVVNTPTILGSPSIINGFSYMFNAGPSLIQSFTVSGASLTTDITVTPTPEFEISKNPAGPFNASVITLTQSNGNVNPTIIYIRLKVGLGANSYSPKITNLTSAGATAKQITCNGLVYVQPTITADVTNPVCNTINLTSSGTGIANQYWTGPLGFYTLEPSATITNATAINNGTYTVTGSALIGLNLVINGDFEAGNVGFSSSYGYLDPIPNALTPEGKYTIAAIPGDVHNDFSSSPDHSDPGTMQMVINGAQTAGIFVWRQTVNIIPNAYYQFTYWVQSVHPLAPSVLQLYVNGVAAGPEYTADDYIDSWKKFVYNWYSGTSSVAELSLINQNTEPNGNDFSIDDIVFQQAVPVTSAVNVVVNPTLTPAVSIAASASPLYSGVPVTFTATPVNGGTAPAYQWKVNGIDVAGANGSTYTYTPATGNTVTCVMTSNYPCTTISSVTSNTLTVNALPNFWMGTFSTDWFNPNNWAALKVPSAGDDIEFATVANNSGNPAIKDLYLDTDRTIGSLINATTYRLVIPPTKGLTANNVINTGDNPDRIYIQSSSSAANGSLIFIQPLLNPSVQATVEMYSKAFYNPGGATNNKYKWQFFGIPISTVTTSPTFDGSYVRIYDETGTTTSNHWKNLINTSELTPLTGYEITQEFGKTFTFRGKLVNTDFSRTLAFTTTTPPAIYPGQHIFGNPYTAAININQLNFGLQTEASIYLYNTGTFDDWTTNNGETTPGSSAGQYTVIPKATAGTGGIPSQIPSMQGFLVKAMSSSADATFGIPYSSVITKNSDQQRAPGARKAGSPGKVYTIIDVKGTRFSDRMWLFSEPTCTRGFDNGWDGEKFLGSALAPQLYAMEAVGDYQVNAVDDINGTELGFWTGEDSNYTLTFTHENLGTKYPAVYLLDLETNMTTDITQSGTTYPFTAQPTPTPVKRFKIVTNQDVSTVVKPTDNTQSGLRVFSAQQTIFVQNFRTENGFLHLYDLTGRFMLKFPFSAMGISTFPTTLVPGSYIAKAITDTEEVNEQLIIK